MLSTLEQSASILLSVGIGLALFLFGMQRLEVGIRELGLNTFQVWLTRTTGSAVASVLAGIGVTAILQSSSLVSLLVLAFASAEVLPLYNAVGILIGANLGTTVTGWLVTLLGFKLSMSKLMMPLLGLGGLLQIFAGRAPRAGAAGWLIFGIGMLLFGLDVMRESTELLTANLDIGALKGYGIAVYFLVGLVVAAAIQSSSATMMLTLMALNNDLITLTAGAAIVIGANLGTTSTVVLASMTGSAVKRQLALAHLIFNTVVDITALFILLPLLPTLVSWVDVEDPLILLVGFHTFFNLLGVLAFMPLLHPFSDWLSRRFAGQPNPALRLRNQPTAIPKVALVAVDKALLSQGAEFVLLLSHYLQMSKDAIHPGERMHAALTAAVAEHGTPDERYRLIKASELSILGFGIELERENLTNAERKRLKGQMLLARAFAYSAKTLKDISADLNAMGRSPHPAVRTLYNNQREYVRHTLDGLFEVFEDRSDSPHREKIDVLEAANELQYQESSNVVSALVADHIIVGEDPSTYLNVNRDIHHSLKGLINATRRWHLEEELP